MAETLSTLSFISFLLAGVFFILGVFLWFFFHIPAVIGDLTGRTARKSIAQMRAVNEKTGAKKYRESKTNLARGKLTDSMSDSTKRKDTKPETGLLVENRAKRLKTEETGLLSEEATGLLVDENETALLGVGEQKREIRGKAEKLTMLEDVMIIHTDEVII